MKRATAEIIQEYGPLPGVKNVGGVKRGQLVSGRRPDILAVIRNPTHILNPR